MSAITTHVLDAVLAKPAAGIPVRLERFEQDRRKTGRWAPVSSGETDADGRCRNLAPSAPAGTYRLTFSTAEYVRRHRRTSIYPEIAVEFDCDGETHYHLPLLFSDNSYTTYRGS
ncbi:MAG TPA: hydroxyisourate hydrolase [Terracidiphilus sp.]|nr:hydroxyisourate hydrolase [Terracidiphilus sp.]